MDNRLKSTISQSRRVQEKVPYDGEETGGNCCASNCREDENFEKRLDIIGCLFWHLRDVLHLEDRQTCLSIETTRDTDTNERISKSSAVLRCALVFFVSIEETWSVAIRTTIPEEENVLSQLNTEF